MDRAKGAKEMSFRRPHHAVELVEKALDDEGTSVVCVAEEESKLFIAFQLFQVARRRFKKAGIMVLLVDDESAGIVKPFLRATSNQGFLSVKTCFDDKDFMKEGHFLVPSFDVMVTKGRLFLKVLRAGLMDLMSFTLIVFDDCHLARVADHPFAILVKEYMLNLKPKMVGVSSEIQHHLTSPLHLERFLNTLAELFHCKPSISSDLLALNRYGEQVEEEIVHYTCLSGNDQFTCELVEIIQKALLFLKDIPLEKPSQECVVFVKHIFTECYKVLSMIGPLLTAYVANIVLAEIKKLERRGCEKYDLLTLQFCRTQMSFILKLSEQYKVKGCKDDLTDMMTKLLHHMSMHLKAEFNEESTDLSTRSQENLVSDVNSSSTKQLEHNAEMSLMCSSSQQFQNQTECTGTFHSSSLQSTYGVKTQCDDPLCIVLVPSVIIAKALNFLINKLSDSMPEYSFLKSAFVCGNKSKQGTLEQGFSDETGNNVMECIQDGSVNIIFATFEVEQELYVHRCSLLMRLGMPKHYTHFLNVKKRVKSAGAKVVFLVREEEKLKTEQNFKVLHKMENVLLERCSNSCRRPSHNIKKLFHEDQGEAYEPFGENGPKVDLLSSISLVNSYCAKFPSNGVGVPVPVCRMEELWMDDYVEFVSTMYLPRNSPIYWPIKASAKVSRDEVNKDTLEMAKVKSEMLVALETCRQLHKAEELSEDLQPLYRLEVFSLTAENKRCDCEVADSGTGVDGSLKRNRAYMRKFPSILKDNVPVCGGPSFLYSITLELTKPWTFERAVRSQSKAYSSGACLSLGLLFRKPLPKLPGMLIFDRAGEVTATVTECASNPVFLNSDQLSLIQRFTEYVFKDIAKVENSFKKVSPKFDPTVATAGYYVVVVKPLQDRSSFSLNAPDCKEIAFDFMHSIESAVGSFDNPTDPPPPGIQDMEAFTDAVVTAIYNDKCLRYYVADICYDRSPADPFPNSEAAATFAEYYEKRYEIKVTLDQPMLDVDHVTSRLNFLLPRYQNTKGQHLSVPGKDSKRSLKSKVFVVPELCSIHPIPGYLWRQLFVLPAVLYRIESLLVAEELRSSVARALRMGAVQWPNDVPLPQLDMGDMVGEEILSPLNCLSKDSKGNAIPEIGRPSVAENCPSRSKCYNSGSSASNRCDSMLKDEASTVLSSSECKSSEAKLGFSELEGANATPEHGSSCQVDHNKPIGELNNDERHTAIWTDPFLSRLYQASGPPSTLILRALTTCSTGDVFSLERLEMLGDSFVKYAVSTSVFFQHLHENEGKLSFIRGLRVSNRQLFYLARQRGLPSYMFTGMFNPLVNWLPPGFYYENSNDVERATDGQLLLMPDKSSEKLEEVDEDAGTFVQEELSGQSRKCDGSSSEANSDRILLDPYLHHCCSDKAVADMTEALVGVYLLCIGPEGAWRFLEWLGMELTKGDETKDGASEEPVITEDSVLTIASAGLDAVASSEDFSKAPCSVQETSDQSSSQLKKTSHLLSTDIKPSKRFSSSDALITNLEEALNCRCKDTSDTTCQKFDSETLPETVPDLSPTRRHLLSSAALLSNQATSNFPPSFQSVHDCVINLPQKPHAISCDSALLSSDTTFVAKFDAVEEALSYRFNNYSLLRQAFTHTSLPRDYNSVRCSYEQLEFLGDALLDFLVTRHLYMYHRDMSPGDLTDLRSAVVNNYSFAALSVKLGFAKHLQSLSPPLFSIVNKFVENLKEKEMKEQQADGNEIYSSVFVLGSEDSDDGVEVEVPKVLGDLFEAVAGALYLDCRQDLETVWRVYLPILKPSIDYYSAKPPMSAVRKLLEMIPNAAKFAPIERMVDGKFKSTLTVSSYGTFVGIGRNFRIAKSTAAQRALAALQKKSSLKKLEKT